MSALQRIRQLVLDRRYDLSAHAEEEMWIMICEFCGGQTIRKKVRKIHWLRQQLYIVDDVEAEVCQECGERYYHATTLDAIDRMLAAGSLPVKKHLRVQIVGMPASSPA